LVLSFVFRRFLIYAIGNTKAALPINTNANKVELTATEIPVLLQLHGNVLRKWQMKKVEHYVFLDEKNIVA